MCRMCRELNEAPGPVPIGPDCRERTAARLAMLDGVCPQSLCVNTLDEEPCDGLIAGAPAHFAWRERLWRADEQLRVGHAGSHAGPWRSPRHAAADRDRGGPRVVDLARQRLLAAGAPC